MEVGARACACAFPSDGLEGGPRETSAAGRCGRQGARRQSSARGALIVSHGVNALRAPLDEYTAKPKIRKVVWGEKERKKERRETEGWLQKKR